MKQSAWIWTTKDEGNSEIERMWAQKRVGRLLSMERAGKGSQRDEIVRLSEGYSIVSPYASMLVLENDGEYKRWKIEQRNATRIVRDRTARDKVQQGLAQMRRQSSESFKLAGADKRADQPTKTDNPNPTPVQQTQPPQDSSRGVDLNVRGGGGGGGAIEPVTACISLSAVGAAAWAERRRKRKAMISKEL